MREDDNDVSLFPVTYLRHWGMRASNRITEWQKQGGEVDMRLDECSSWAPIHLFAAEDDAEAIKTLVHCSANINCKTYAEQCTALHIASKFGATSAIHTLLDCGIAIDAQDKVRRSPARCHFL